VRLRRDAVLGADAFDRGVEVIENAFVLIVEAISPV
jgi:hypothetical protein